MEEFREEVLELAKKIYDAGVKKAEDKGLYKGFKFCKKLFFLSNKTKEKIFGTDVMLDIFKTYSVDEIKEALRNDANKHPIGTRVVTIEERDPTGTPLFPIGTICKIIEYNANDSETLGYKLQREDGIGTTWWYADNMFDVIEEQEQEEEALKVGDEIEHKFNDFKAIVTRIIDDEYVDVIYNKDDRKGVTSTVVLSNYKRTGKNYSQLVDLLNMLDNSKEEDEEDKKDEF